MTKIIGIIGGMGPLASVDLQEKIIKNTRADIDADHLHVITDCNTQIPDRTAAILEGGRDALPKLVESAKRLEQAGAEVLLIACNTAHYYLEDLKKEVGIPFISLIESSVITAKKRGIKKLSILSTTASYMMGLYQEVCLDYGIDYLDHDEDDFQLLMEIIYAVKSGDLHRKPQEMRAFLQKEVARGSEAFILGCSELPIYFAHNDMGVEVLDSTLCLARSAIVYAGGQLL